MRTLVIQLILAFLVPLALLYPFVGLLGYYWASIMNPYSLVWGASGIPWAKIIGAATLIAWVFSREPKRVPFSSVAVLLVMFLAWTAFTSFFAVVPGPWQEWFDLAKVALMALVAMALVSSRERLHAFVWVVVISVGYWTVKGGLFVTLTAANWEVRGPPAFQENNEMARASIMVLPLMYFLYLHSAKRYVRGAMAFAALMTVLALMGTSSRGGFLAFAAMAGFVWLHSRRKLVLSGLGLTAVLAGFLLLPGERLAGWTERMEVIAEYETYPTVQSRFDSWGFAIDVANRRPLTGGGFDVFRRNHPPDRPERWRDAHNHYFKVLGEHGYVGVFLFLLLGLFTFRTGSRIMRRARDHPELYWARDLALMLQVGLVGYFVGGITINHAYFELYYVLMAMMVITRALVERELGARGTEKRFAELPGWRTVAAADRPRIPDRPIIRPGIRKPNPEDS